jgi:drug/metabolite transporter (DMT)-like permease
MLWKQWWLILLIVIGLLLVLRRSVVRLSRWEAPRDPQRPEGPVTATPTRIRLRGKGSTAGIILIGLGVAFLLQERLGGATFPAVLLIARGVAILLR